MSYWWNSSTVAIIILNHYICGKIIRILLDLKVGGGGLVDYNWIVCLVLDQGQGWGLEVFIFDLKKMEKGGIHKY